MESTPTPEKGNGKTEQAVSPHAWKRGSAENAKRAKRDDKIRAALKANPKLSYEELARKLKVHVSRVYRVLRLDGALAGAPRKSNAKVVEMRAKIMALYNAGIGRQEICKRLGVSTHQVDKARKAAAKKPEVYRTPHTVSQERQAQAEALFAQGLKPKAVAERLGVDVSSVYYYKAKMEGRGRASGLVKEAVQRMEHAEQPMAEMVNWLKHGYQEALAAIRKGRDPTISECYSIVAYLKATGKG